MDEHIVPDERELACAVGSSDQTTCFTEGWLDGRITCDVDGSESGRIFCAGSCHFRSAHGELEKLWVESNAVVEPEGHDLGLDEVDVIGRSTILEPSLLYGSI